MHVGKLLLLVIVLLVALKIVVAIECFECNSHTDPDCAPAVNTRILATRLLKDCNQYKDGPPRVLCRKAVQVIATNSTADRVDDVRVIRWCGWDDSHYNGSCYHMRSFDHFSTICSCHEDGCNGVAERKETLLGAILSVLFVAFWVRQ